MNLEQEVGNVLIAVRHALETLDLVIDAFRDSSRNPADKVVQDEVPFPEELVAKLNESRDFRLDRRNDPLPQGLPGRSAIPGSVDCQKLLFEKHSPVDRFIKIGELFQDALPTLGLFVLH